MNDTDFAIYDAVRWLKFSENDLNAALHLIKKAALEPRYACWLSQQAERAIRQPWYQKDSAFHIFTI